MYSFTKAMITRSYGDHLITVCVTMCFCLFSGSEERATQTGTARAAEELTGVGEQEMPPNKKSKTEL